MSILRGITGNQKKEVTDNDIIQWANNKVTSGKKIKDFKDPILKNGVYLIELLQAISPSSVDPKLITKGETEGDQMLNAKYAISVARQLGCCMFVCWEDLVDVKQKMVMTFIATLMSVFP